MAKNCPECREPVHMPHKQIPYEVKCTMNGAMHPMPGQKVEIKWREMHLRSLMSAVTMVRINERL